jgi:hypothetical protein
VLEFSHLLKAAKPLAPHNPVFLGVLMSVSSSRSSLILFLLVVCVFTLNVSAATKRKHPKPAKQEQPAPTPAIVETPPPAELTLEQKPAVPPTVTYQNRQLTIVAENSTLGDILRAVKAQTGASIELPANTNARIVNHIGPGPSRDVLAQLLNGTLFNYVLLGTVNDPAAVGKIILIPKPMGAGTESAANVQPNIQPQPQNYPNVNMPGQSGDEADPDTETTTTTEEDNSANVPEPEQPAAAPPNGQQPNLRTPEQLLQELQRQQQLQQQMQQQQGNPQPNQQGPDPNQQQ